MEESIKNPWGNHGEIQKSMEKSMGPSLVVGMIWDDGKSADKKGEIPLGKSLV